MFFEHILVIEEYIFYLKSYSIKRTEKTKNSAEYGISS